MEGRAAGLGLMMRCLRLGVEWEGDGEASLDENNCCQAYKVAALILGKRTLCLY